MAKLDTYLFPILDQATDYMALGAVIVLALFGLAEYLSKFKVVKK